MRRMAWVPVLLVGLIVFSSVVFAQKIETEGKAWLDAKTEPAEINVNGVWSSDNWGNVILNQAAGSREVTGTADNWEIRGVVSGKELFLLFFSKGVVAYSAELSQGELDTLGGLYAKGLMSAEKSKTRSIQLKMPHSAEAAKPSAKDNAAGMANNGPAHAVVFREKEFNCRYHGKLYIDGKELARSRNGRYFTVTLPPGKHIIGGKGGSQSATVDSTSPSTYYLRVTDVSAWMCFYDVTAIDAEAAMSMIPRMRPAEAKDILMPEIVSLEPISVK